jgi:hypothetical protein
MAQDTRARNTTAECRDAGAAATRSGGRRATAGAPRARCDRAGLTVPTTVGCGRRRPCSRAAIRPPPPPRSFGAPPGAAKACAGSRERVRPRVCARAAPGRRRDARSSLKSGHPGRRGSRTRRAVLCRHATRRAPHAARTARRQERRRRRQERDARHGPRTATDDFHYVPPPAYDLRFQQFRQGRFSPEISRPHLARPRRGARGG